MPNRVDANISGIRPTVARQPTERTERPEQPEPQARAQEPADAARTDRVELSADAQARVRATRPDAAGGDEDRAASLNAPGAGEPDTTGLRGAVTGPTQERAEQVREDQVTARQQQAPQPREQQGNLVDVVA